MQTDFSNTDTGSGSGLKQDGTPYKILIVDDLVKKSFMPGASNYIIKPLNRDRVIERLSYVLNS